MHDTRAELGHRSALILYGTETGNAQDVAEELGRLVERLHFSARVSELNDVTLVRRAYTTSNQHVLAPLADSFLYFKKELLQYQVVLVAIATTGQGDLPANSLSFWKALRSARLRPGCLQRLQFVSFGLGDSSYPQFVLLLLSIIIKSNNIQVQLRAPQTIQPFHSAWRSPTVRAWRVR